MKIAVPLAVHSSTVRTKDAVFTLETGNDQVLNVPGTIAYPPFINAHDHLISNWYPRAGENGPYINSHIWVEDMRQSASFLERNRIWLNDGKFDLMAGTAPWIIDLGVYKNLFSGVAVVQDHGPLQAPAYYRNRPIEILERYRQCHSLTLGNWWGGKTPREELDETGGEIPFIVHLGEGLDDVTRGEFAKLVELGLDRPNTMLVHGISLTRDEITHCARTGMNLCWCPSSNMYLIGQTLDVQACLDAGVNVALGTDSPMSGAINMFDELRCAHETLPAIPLSALFDMVTVNAAKALYLSDRNGLLSDSGAELLVLEARKTDPFENLLACDMNDIRLFVSQGRPILGHLHLLEPFGADPADYACFRADGVDRFVLGHPDRTLSAIRARLGIPKTFPFLPL